MNADEVYNRAFLRYMRLTTPVFSFNVVLDKALPRVESEFLEIGLQLAHELVAKNLIIDPDRFFREGMDKLVAEQYVTSTLKGARSVARASAIIFSHSILDAIAFDACRVTLIAAPDEWAAEVRSRKVSLETVRTTGYDKIRDAELSDYFEQLERESVLKKCDLLHARCRPEPSWDFIENYKYDRERLKEFDDLRHKIVHADKLSEEIDDVSATLMYISNTCLYLLLLVSKRFGVKIDPYFGIREQLKPSAVTGGGG
jgi:hypothetical protein